MEAIFAAYTICSLKTRKTLNELAFELLGEDLPAEYHMETAHLQSVSFRLSGRYADSDRCLQFCLDTYAGATDSPRIRALHAKIENSRVSNCLRQNRRTTEPTEDPAITRTLLTELELRVNEDTQIQVARLIQSEGEIALAAEAYEQVLRLAGLSKIKKLRITSYLLEMYCELGREGAADEILRGETKKVGLRKGKALRRFLITSAEVNIARVCYNVALQQLEQFRIHSAAVPDLDTTDELYEMRAYTAAARVYHLQSDFQTAIHRWTGALDFAKRSKSFKDQGFTTVVIRISIAHAYLNLSSPDNAWEWFQSATSALSTHQDDPRDFWIPAMAASWLRYVLAGIWVDRPDWMRHQQYLGRWSQPLSSIHETEARQVQTNYDE